jgi:hypothetical protein
MEQHTCLKPPGRNTAIQPPVDASLYMDGSLMPTQLILPLRQKYESKEAVEPFNALY